MSIRIGYNSTLMKHRNRGIALQLIATEGLSRAEMTKRMGLSKMAITKIVNELMEDGYIAEGQPEENAGVGRNPTLLEISPMAPIAMGVYLSRNEVCVLLCDLRMEVLFTDSLALHGENADTLTDKLFSLCDAAMEYAGRVYPGVRLLGIGVSAIGPLDPATVRILHPTDFFGIVDYPVGKLLNGRYHLPVFLENDMNASALFEKLYGTGRCFEHFVYLGITNGIGAGVIMNGKLARKSSISYGEIGHTSIQFEGPLCTCGNRGCLEVYANMPVILRELEGITGKPVLPPDLPGIMEDSRCAKQLYGIGKRLTVALINLVNMLDPQCIIIGHDGSYLPDLLLTELERAVNRGMLSSGYQSVVIRRSDYGNRSPKLGSVSLVFDQLFAGRFATGGVVDTDTEKEKDCYT